MSRYGINYYGSSYYGYAASVDYSVTDFSAVPFGHSQIKLNWTSPSGLWSRLRLVRGTYGFPVTAYEGKELLEVYYGFDPASFLDNSDIMENRFYYYSLFVYDISDYKWIKAGDVSALSVKDYKTASLLYDYIPEPYKYTSLTSAKSNEINNSLYNFLSIFGFELDKYRTFIENATRKYNVSVSNGAILPSLLKEFGLKFEPELGLQQARILTRDAVQLYQEKSSNQGIREYIKAFSGYAVPNPSSLLLNPGVNGIVVGHNLMLDYNASSFEESVGVWKNQSNASLEALTHIEIVKYQLTSNVLTLTLDREHGYTVGDKVFISNSPIPLINTTSFISLTNTTLTTVSFAKSFYDIAETKTTGTVSPYPAPWDEPTTINNYSNKQSGILKVSNSTSSTATVSISADVGDPVKSGIPVVVGSPYTFSAYSTGSIAKNVTLKINWYDRFGVFISTVTGSAISNGTGPFSIRPYVTGSAPANTRYAVPIISIASVGNAASNEHHYFDAVQFEQSSTMTEFDEARNLHITLKASRINELVNPNFAGSVLPWNILNCSFSSDASIPDPDEEIYEVYSYFIQDNFIEVSTTLRHEIKAGDIIYIDGISGAINNQYTVSVVTQNTITFAFTASNLPATAVTATISKSGSVIKLISNSTTPVEVESSTGDTSLIPIYYPNSSFTFSIYARSYNTPETGYSTIYWYDGGNSIIGQVDGDLTTINNDWTRVFVTAESPTLAVNAKVIFHWNPSAANKDLAMDHALFENTPFVLPYFDGTKGTATSDELFWEGGLTNQNRSHLYTNRLAVEGRLKLNLPEYLVAGTTFTLYLAQPKT